MHGIMQFIHYVSNIIYLFLPYDVLKAGQIFVYFCNYCDSNTF